MIWTTYALAHRFGSRPISQQMLNPEISTFPAVTPQEEKIIRRLKSDPKGALSLIYDHYADALYGVLKTMLRDDEMASDVLQEAMIKVWKNAGNYDSKKAKLFTWLMRIARNAAIDRLRSEGRRADSVIRTELSNVHIGVDGFQPDHLDMQQHLNGLDEKYASVIRALFFMGMTQEEASEALEIPLGTVKSRLRIGIRELKNIYTDPMLLWIMILLNQG